MKTKTQTLQARKNVISEIKNKRQENQTELFKEIKLFFAFGNDQFEEGMKKHNITGKVISIGGGGYLPSENVDKFFEGMKKLEKDYKNQVKEYKEELIKYELNNYECHYTGNIDDVVYCLKGIATRKQIEKVFTNK